MLPDPRSLLARNVYYGWIVTIACFLTSVVVFGTTYTFSVFYDALIVEFGMSRSSLAFVFGLQTALIYVSGIGVGRLIERHGQRRVTAASSAILVGGLTWAAFARSYFELLAAFGIVTAFGLSGLYIVSYATLPSWFERRLGTAGGVASSGLGVGLVVIPFGADAVISTLGWRTAMLGMAGGMALLAVTAVLLLADDHSDVDADASVEFGESGPTGTDDRRDTTADVREIVTAPPFALVFLGWTLIFTPLYAVLSHIVLHATEIGIGRSTGVYAITVIGVTTGISRVGIGSLSDRLGRPRTFVGSGILLGGATVGLSVAPTAGYFLVGAAAFGIGYGGCGGLIGAITADVFGKRSLNTLFAVLSLSFAVSGLLAPPLAGLWFESSGSYRLAFIIAGTVGVVGSGCTMLGVKMRADRPRIGTERGT